MAELFLTDEDKKRLSERMYKATGVKFEVERTSIHHEDYRPIFTWVVDITKPISEDDIPVKINAQSDTGNGLYEPYAFSIKGKESDIMAIIKTLQAIYLKEVQENV